MLGSLMGFTARQYIDMEVTDMKETTIYRSIEELPLVLIIDDLMAVLNIGRNSAYELVRSGQIKSFRIGTQIRIPRQAVADFLVNTAA